MKKGVFGISVFGLVSLIVSCSPATSVSQVRQNEMTFTGSFPLYQDSKVCNTAQIENKPLKPSDKISLDFKAEKGFSAGFEVTDSTIKLCIYATKYPIPRRDYEIEITSLVNENRYFNKIQVSLQTQYSQFRNFNFEIDRVKETCVPATIDNNQKEISGEIQNDIQLLNSSGITGTVKSIKSVLNFCFLANKALPGKHRIDIVGHLENFGFSDLMWVIVPTATTLN
jgi:hypothetical protein